MREAEWVERARAHEERARPWVEARLARRAAGLTHAIDDFLFDYYPFSPTKLATWHPGWGVELEGPGAKRYLEGAGYCETPNGATADIRYLDSKLPRLETAILILEGTQSREPMVGCFGLHEWAMVYGQSQEEVRHAYLPLRVTPQTVSQTVDEVGLRCTHIDAYRFFTPAASLLNEGTPTRALQPSIEQPGCLHAGMDLYKLAAWFSPLVGSDLVLDCFENAAHARELDMRASPYDMAPFGIESVPVETIEGRRQYVELQRELMTRTAPLRSKLLSTLTELRAAI